LELAAPVNVDGALVAGVTTAVVGDATPPGMVEVWANVLMVEFEKPPVGTVELERPGTTPVGKALVGATLVGTTLVGATLVGATPVGAAQVTHATLVETVTGITAVHGQSVMVTVVASVMVEVSDP